MISDRVHMPILLVEDDPLLGATMRRHLERFADDVRHAETVAAARNCWSALSTAIILMDYRLPDGKGTDLISQMRAQGREDPVIFMTGESEVLTPDVVDQLAIHQVLVKPVMLDALRETLTALPALQTRKAPAHRRSTRRAGKFRHVCWRGELTGPRVARLCRAAQGESWVALDVDRAQMGDEAGWRGLCAWSGWLSGAGGRLSLVAANPQQRESVRAAVGEYVDIVPEIAVLSAQGNRLTGTAERRQLLRLVGLAHTSGDFADG
jgi:CheY-like chemotaxis protein